MESNKETISRLKFIGRIQIGDKVNLKSMYIQPDGLITQLLRSINQDNRSKTLIFLQDTISKTFEILKCYELSTKLSERIMCNNLILDLKNSKSGLHNLKETYIMDVKFVCDIDTLLQSIDAKLDGECSVLLSIAEKES
jgi:hypothetical protein